MKKYLFIILFIQLPLYAQWNTHAIKLGTFIPSSSGAGFIVGYEGSHFFDPQFSFGWSIDWYHSSYTDEKVANDFNNLYGINVRENQLRASTNVHDFPLMGILTVRFPVTPVAEVYANGALGAEALFIGYSNFQNPNQNDFKTAFDFNWQIGIGASYGFSKRAEAFGELAYHYSQPSWTYEVIDPTTGQKDTYQRVIDMSGMMLRVGMRFYY